MLLQNDYKDSDFSEPATMIAYTNDYITEQIKASNR